MTQLDMLVTLVYKIQESEGVNEMFGGAIAGFVLFLSLKLEGVHASRVGVHTNVINIAIAPTTSSVMNLLYWLDLYPFELQIITTSDSSGLSTS
jgi:hypothetical protein